MGCIISCFDFEIMQKCRLTFQVTDVLAVAIKELRSNSSNRQNVVEGNSTKGEARLLFPGTRSRRTGGGAVTDCYATVL